MGEIIIKDGIGWCRQGSTMVTVDVGELAAEIERLRAHNEFMRDYLKGLRCPVRGREWIGECQQCGCTAGLLIKGDDEQPRQWCESCGAVSDDGTCDCTRDGRAPKFVPYNDEQSWKWICEACGTLSNDKQCDCTKFDRPGKFVAFEGKP